MARHLQSVRSPSSSCRSGSSGRGRAVRPSSRTIGQPLDEPVDPRRPAGHQHTVDPLGRRRGLEEVERLLNLEEQVLGDRPQNRRHVVETHAVGRLALLDALSALERQAEFLLDGLGEGVAAHRDVAREERLLAADDIDIHAARARVQQRDHRSRFDVIVGLEGVLHGKRVDIDHHRRQARLADHIGVIADLLLLRRDEQDFHAALRIARRRGDDLVVEVHILDVERDVLFGLPVNRLGQLLLGHHRQVDLLDDDGVARQRRHDILCLDLSGVE